MKAFFTNLPSLLKPLLLAIVLSLGVSYVYAWTGPTATPPAENTPPPLNVGSVSQVKTGGIWAGSLGADGALQVNGPGGYGPLYVRSWGLDGTGDLYIEPDAGRNLLLSDTGNGTGIFQATFGKYRFLVGSVGIGVQNPAAGTKLDVAGQVNADSAAGAGGYTSTGNYGGTGSAAYFPQGLWSNGTNAWIYGTRYVNGSENDTTAGVLRDAGGGWLHTYGSTGLKNETNNTSVYSQDTTWVRATPNLYSRGEVQAPTVKGTTQVCIGSVCRSTWPSLQTSSVLITSSQEWPKPEGVSLLGVECVGGGGSGDSSGGGPGYVVSKSLVLPTAQQNITVTIGDPGWDGCDCWGGGDPGDASSFGSYVSAPGGDANGYPYQHTLSSFSRGGQYGQGGTGYPYANSGQTTWGAGAGACYITYQYLQ
ncbi:hypothetical protein KW797_01630 [Candidatus Parcubacteria bacterium]|nr:hypothetical protein [Candidatus Parcubacteria bacterium]